MIFRILLLTIICGGLFNFGFLTLRHIGLLGLYAYLAPKIGYHLIKYRNINFWPFILTLMALVFLFLSILNFNDHYNKELFFRYMFLYMTGFLTYILLSMFKFLEEADLKKVILNTSIVLIVFSILNVIFIIYTPQPFAAISILTGTPIENFARLYNRIIMPFGHPAQLGFVASCSALTLLSLKSNFKIQSLIFILIIITLLTYASSILIPMIFIVGILIIRKTLIKPYFLVVLMISGIAISALLILALILDVPMYGRDISSIIESVARHYMLRSQTINEISGFNLLEFILGIGVGQSRFYIDGSYSFTVLLTQLLEGGMVLVLIQLTYFVSLSKYCNNIYSWSIWWLTFSSSFLYQINNDITFYIYPIMCIMLAEQIYEKNPS